MMEVQPYDFKDDATDRMYRVKDLNAKVWVEVSGLEKGHKHATQKAKIAVLEEVLTQQENFGSQGAQVAVYRIEEAINKLRQDPYGEQSK